MAHAGAAHRVDRDEKAGGGGRPRLPPRITSGIIGREEDRRFHEEWLAREWRAKLRDVMLGRYDGFYHKIDPPPDLELKESRVVRREMSAYGHRVYQAIKYWLEQGATAVPGASRHDWKRWFTLHRLMGAETKLGATVRVGRVFDADKDEYVPIPREFAAKILDMREQPLRARDWDERWGGWEARRRAKDAGEGKPGGGGGTHGSGAREQAG